MNLALAPSPDREERYVETERALKDALKRIELRGLFRLVRVRFTVEREPGQAPKLAIRIRVPSVENGDLTEIGSRRICENPPLDDDEVIHLLILPMLIDALEHEVYEGLYVDGRQAFDPHTKRPR